MLIGAFYRNELAARVAALGYDLEPSRAGHVPSFEIRGYGRPVLRSFSTRRRDILRWVEKHGGEEHGLKAPAGGAGDAPAQGGAGTARQ